MQSHERINSQREALDLIKARYPLLYLVSSEEPRVESALKKIATDRELRLEVWSVTEGFRTVFGGQGTRDIHDPFKALEYVLQGEDRCIYVLRDFHPFLKEPKVVRKVRDLVHKFQEQRKHVCIVSPVQTIPPELEKNVAVLDWDLPDRAEVEAIAKRLFPQLPAT